MSESEKVESGKWKEESKLLSGWLILDKPEGITSARAVAIVKRKLGVSKIGHAGTLDPFASGVLPLAIGEATKTVRFLVADTKEYQFTVKWGEATDTDDCTGKVIATSNVRPEIDQVNEQLKAFIGEIDQVPPQYSAIKMNGQRAYSLARKGQEVNLAARKIIVHEFKLLDYDNDSASFFVKCGKGTYIRSLAKDLASRLGTCGNVSCLRRLKVGKFSEKDAILLEDMEKLVYKAGIADLLPVDSVLDDIPVLEISGEQSVWLRQGKKISFSGAGCENDRGQVFLVRSLGVPVALTEVEAGYLKPLRVFNL